MSTADAPAAAPAPSTKGQPSATKSFLSGGFGGICLVAAGHPLDTLKVLVQTSNQYKGMGDAFRQTVARDGVRGLYRGMATPLIGVTPTFSVCFWGYDQGKKLSRWMAGTDANAPLSLTQIGFAGALSAVPTTLLMTPMERVKVVLQVQTDGKYKGPVDVVRKIVAEQGVKGMFTGTTATLVRDSVGSVGYFVTYEFLKRAFTPAGAKPEDLSPVAVFMAGGFAGMANWAVAIPADSIKSLVQSAPPGKYSGFTDALVKTVRSDGPSALFRGLGPAMLRAFPANAACFLGVEVSLKVMNSLW